MSYDPQARRDTPLALALKARLRRQGPLSVADYMQACLHDPQHGYYRRMPAIGARGDFVTAPEVSQVFGELIGLWCAVVWQQMGAPGRLHLVELGPGRGTMLRDALRAIRVLPAFAQAAEVHLVEPNAALRAEQRAALAGSAMPMTWHDDLDALLRPTGALPPGATIVLANELLDTLAIEQHVWRQGAWRRRLVGLDAAGRLAFTEAAAGDTAHASLPPPPGDGIVEGSIAESCPGHAAIAARLAARAGQATLAALFIDYGHAAPMSGDTLQAVGGHRQVSPLYAPGESDLTAQVDFAAFVASCRDHQELATDGPVTQAEFLGRLGIVERASRLMGANPGRAAEIEAGVARLIAPGGMGSRFKALGVRSAGLSPLPGLDASP